MRSLRVSLALGLTAILVGVAASAALAQRGRPMMPAMRPAMGRPQAMMVMPASPMMGMPRGMMMFNPFSPGMGMPQAGMFNPYSSALASSAAYQMPSGGSGMAMPSGGYNPYQMSPGGYGSSSPYATSEAAQSPGETAGGDVEVSGPMSTPPPRRGVIRLRLPHTWVPVWIDGQGVDSMGRSRTYVTPELSGPQTFTVTAAWQHNGRSVLLQEQVTVNVGEVRTLDFTSGN